MRHTSISSSTRRCSESRLGWKFRRVSILTLRCSAKSSARLYEFRVKIGVHSSTGANAGRPTFKFLKRALGKRATTVPNRNQRDGLVKGGIYIAGPWLHPPSSLAPGASLGSASGAFERDGIVRQYPLRRGFWRCYIHNAQSVYGLTSPGGCAQSNLQPRINVGA